MEACYVAHNVRESTTFSIDFFSIGWFQAETINKFSVTRAGDWFVRETLLTRFSVHCRRMFQLQIIPTSWRRARKMHEERERVGRTNGGREKEGVRKESSPLCWKRIDALSHKWNLQNRFLHAALRATSCNIHAIPKLFATSWPRARALKLSAKDAGGSIVRVVSNDRSIASVEETDGPALWWMNANLWREKKCFSQSI